MLVLDFNENLGRCPSRRIEVAPVGALIPGRVELACQGASSAKEYAPVRYRLQITEKAREHLRVLPRDVRRAVGYRMELMCDDLRGDVTKLRDKTNRYRLRVGTFRVLFSLAGDEIQVYAVKDRKEAYD